MTIDEKRKSNAESAARNRFLSGSLDKKLLGLKKGAFLLKRKYQVEMLLTKIEQAKEEINLHYASL